MRSMWTLAILALLLGLHAASLNLPWYTYSHSSGRTLPPEFPSNETGENVTVREYYPFQLRGDVNATQVHAAQELTQPLGIGVSITIALVVIAFAVELLWGHDDRARWPGMILTSLGLLLTLAMLLFVFFAFPPTLSGEGVTGTFTNRQTPTGFVRSTVGWGWLLGGIAILAHLAHFAFRFQQGSFDLGFVDRLQKKNP